MEKEDEIKAVLSQRRIYAAIFICVLITAFIYYREFTNNTGNINAITWTWRAIFYLFIALVMMAFRDLAYMVRVRILTGKQLNWKQSFTVIMLWEFASAISPGVVGGSAVALFILQREKIPIGKSTALVIITLILDNLFYLLFIPAVFLFIDLNSLFPANLDWIANEGMTLFWLGYGLILAITIILALSVFYSPKIIHFFVRLLFKLPFLKKRKAKAEEFSRDIETASKELKHKKAPFWLQLFGATVWSWISRFLVVNFVLFAFIELQLIDHFMILARQLVMWLLMLITPTPGGGGMAEFAFSELFTDYILTVGISGASLALIWRTLSYYPYLAIGSILLPRWLRKRG